MGEDFKVPTKSNEPYMNDRSSNVTWDEEEKTGSLFRTESNAGISTDHHDRAVAVGTTAQVIAHAQKTAYLCL